MPTTSDYLEQLKADKENLISILNERGVETTGSETFTDLVPKTLDIKTPPVLQNKNITITENTTTNIVADNGYDGLNAVSVTTNISGGAAPTKGFSVEEWDSDGYAKAIKIYGLTTLPDYAFKFSSSPGWGVILSKIYSYDFNNIVTSLGFASLQSNAELTEIKNWGVLTTIGKYGLSGCTKFNPKTLPDSLITLDDYAFLNNSGMTQISMNNVVTIGGTANNVGAFNNCTNLKAVWLGSAINKIYRYSFQGCTNLQKIYIDLPRAEVTSKSGYTYAFMNNTSKTNIIVCNDDSDFITKEEFDAIDWSTQ